MIKLTRERDKSKIHDNFFNPKRERFERELLLDQKQIAEGIITEHSWDSNRWKKAKDQLTKETCGKCAYCEAPWAQVAYGDVEHYRPKSKYWWLAYCYENYLVSCTLCNQKYKKAHFRVKNNSINEPEILASTSDEEINNMVGSLTPDPTDLEQVDTFCELHRQERPLLINPYYDNPEDYFAWNIHTIKREVELIPLPDNDETIEFCEEAKKYYGLNRKQLKDYRYALYERYYTFRLTLMEPQISQNLRQRILDMISKLKSKTSEYAGMVRYLDSLPFEELPEPVII